MKKTPSTTKMQQILAPAARHGASVEKAKRTAATAKKLPNSGKGTDAKFGERMGVHRKPGT